MKHNQLLSLKRQPPNANQPWRPDCAVLPSGLVLHADFLRTTTDPILFNEMFGNSTVDLFTRKLMREGYANWAELTTSTLNKAMQC